MSNVGSNNLSVNFSEMTTQNNWKHAFSISGYLLMKHLGGALSIWRPRRRFYCAIDEVTEELVYHKTELDFTLHREPFGCFPISSAVITLNDHNNCIFILHISGRSIEFEAENEKSCSCWLDAFSNRFSDAEREKYFSTMLRKPKKSSSLPDQESALTMTDQNRENNRKYSVPAKHGRTNQLTPMSYPDMNEFVLPNEEIDDWVTQWLRNETFQNSSNFTNPTIPSSTVHSKLSSSTESDNFRTEHEEIEHLRDIVNNQKKQIEELKHEMNSLTLHLEQMRKRCDSTNGSDRDTLSAQNKFLNSEILRMSAKSEVLEIRAAKTKKENKKVTEELQLLRCDYVHAIQSSIHIPLHDNSALDVMSMKLVGGETHKMRLIQLMTDARQDDPSLPTLQSLLQGLYVDSFGFRVSFKDETIALHFMATKLHQFYSNRSRSFIEHKQNWKRFLEENTFINLNRETKNMCRNGIPNSLRATVWKILINQQVKDLKESYGKYYFRNLCNTQEGESQKLYSETHQKQINLDLLRTMPNNLHFMNANSKGVTQMLQVLHAFCLHNPQIGYCQGMNFIAATALLFVGPEDAFWFLIAITERYFDKTYFDSNLTGAQADQEVLKDLLEVQHPKIMRHFESLEIDPASITLNWFIALFFDAVPFNTLLRIWDCFLLEGSKVLFRFALILIGKHEEEIISRHDAIGIMKVSKAASRLAFDEQAIVDHAFNIQHLPSRAELKALQLQYVTELAEKLEQKNKRATAFVHSISKNFANDKLISNIFINDFCPNHGFVVSGHHLLGKIAKINIERDRTVMKDIDIEFDCRVMSICMVRSNMAYISLISGYLLVAHIGRDDDWSILWELKLPDVATFLIYRQNTLFVGLANGNLTVFENAEDKWPTSVEMWHMPLSSSPLMSAIIHDNILTVATACKLISLDALSLTIISTTHVVSSNAGTGVIYFDKITCMCKSPSGIFLTTDHSTLIQVWNETSCQLLYDVSFDHKTRKPSLSESDTTMHIESLLYNDQFLWIGTSDGYVFIYSTDEEKASDEQDVKYRLKQFNCRQTSETDEEITRKCSQIEDDENEAEIINDFNQEKRASRVSISIDRETQQYSVAAIVQSSEKGKDVNRNGSSSSNSCTHTIRFPVKKGYSADSAVSVFSSEPFTDGKNELIEQFENQLHKTGKNCFLLNPDEKMESSNTSSTSLEYDDTFELYSDEEKSRRRVEIISKKKLGSIPTDGQHRKVQLKRKDLSFEEPYIISVQERNDREMDVDTKPVIPTIKLNLIMKLKISDLPVRKILVGGSSKILTCSGFFDEDEALLVWRKDGENNVWINDPVVCKNSFQK